jgi:hypothetical protein
MTFSDIKPVFAVVAAVMAIYANWGYMREVIHEKVKPHPYTWFLWSIVSLVVFFAQLVKGAGWGLLPTFFAEVFTVIIFFYSLKHGFKNIRKIDHFFLLVALLGLVPWYITKDPTISVIVVVIIDLIAFMPTIVKTWNKPRSENPYFYELNIIRHILALCSLQTYSIATSFHSIVMVFANASIPETLWLRKWYKGRK